MPQRSTLTVALIGNPNTGKSTLFTSLAGVRQRVGNYPGVTVEKKLGSLDLDGQPCRLVDLPGTYSLAPRSPDEMVAVDVLLGRQADVDPIDAVLSIIDANNLERNLYLLSQVLELGVPVVVALNMGDIARARGLRVDAARLQKQLGVPVVARGAGTSLAGGSLPTADSIILGTARLNKTLEIDLANRFIRVESGVTNLSVTGAVEGDGFFYAPDPSSQLACAIAGNIAMNSGGAHCLKYGVTTNNLLGVKMVLADGEIVELGGAHLDAEGYDQIGRASCRERV